MDNENEHLGVSLSPSYRLQLLTQLFYILWQGYFDCEEDDDGDDDDIDGYPAYFHQSDSHQVGI